jgi:aminotransferase
MKELLASRSVRAQQSSIRAVTRRIEAVRGVNLGQGTCELMPHPMILEAAREAISAGHNSYTLYDGIPTLKEAIVDRCRTYNRLPVTQDNVVVTAGATGGLECVCKCFLDPGDEVILFEPTYQYHVRLIVERGAMPKFVRLSGPEWSFRVEDLSSAFSERTKLLVFANPNNPTGKVFTREELLCIGNECRRHSVVAVVDEVYEYILSPGYEHVSLASLPGLFDHAITLSSASKSLFVTGWRVGWLTAPLDVIGSLGVKSDETYVCAPAPLQHGVEAGMKLGDAFFASIKETFNQQRLQLGGALIECGLVPLSPQGTYYTLADYSHLGFSDDLGAMDAFIDQIGVAAVPGSSFYGDGENTGLLRFCFAVTSDKLSRACDLLSSKRFRPLQSGGVEDFGRTG